MRGGEEMQVIPNGFSIGINPEDLWFSTFGIVFSLHEFVLVVWGTYLAYRIARLLIGMFRNRREYSEEYVDYE